MAMIPNIAFNAKAFDRKQLVNIKNTASRANSRKNSYLIFLLNISSPRNYITYSSRWKGIGNCLKTFISAVTVRDAAAIFQNSRSTEVCSLRAVKTCVLRVPRCLTVLKVIVGCIGDTLLMVGRTLNSSNCVLEECVTQEDNTAKLNRKFKLRHTHSIQQTSTTSTIQTLG